MERELCLKRLRTSRKLTYSATKETPTKKAKLEIGKFIESIGVSSDKTFKELNLVSDYIEDILVWVKVKETKVTKLSLVSPQLSRRRQLISWSCEMAVQLRLSTLTVHLAVKLLDYFMAGHDIEEPQQYLVCLGCLQLAAKIHEKDGNIPRNKKLVRLLPKPLPLSAFQSLELMMLNFFKFDLLIPTSCYMTELLLPQSIHPSDKQYGQEIYNFRRVKEDLHEVVKEMLDVSLKEESMMLVPASVMAGCVILASRLVCCLAPSWPRQLLQLTGYTRDKLESVTDSLVTLHKLQGEIIISVDEGYHSNVSSPTK